jgi:hypothetical protein
MEPIRNLVFVFIFIFIALLFCSAADALEIIKVKGNKVLLRLDGEKVSVGEQLEIIDANGRKKGIVEVTNVSTTKAVAKVESGPSIVGMKVTKRAGVAVKNPADNFDPRSNHNFNFRLNPVGLISGGIDANLDFKITQNWTVGPQGIYLHAKLSPSGIFNSDYDVTAYGFGARANWFFTGAMKDGYYLGPSLEYLRVNIKTGDSLGPASGTASGLMASCLIGYGWFWDNVNIMLGGGYGAVLGTSSITIKDTAGNQEIITANLSGIALEFSLGWAF